MDPRERNKVACPTCLKFISKTNLNRHMVTHNPDAKVKCEICRKFFKTPQSLSFHIKMHHTSRDRPSCDTCHREFATSETLRNHMDTVHNMTKRYRFPCGFPECAKTYWTKNGVSKHTRTEHAENPIRFPCTLCGKEFKTRQVLESHIPTHTKEKAFTCSTCGRSFARRTAMKRHELTHLEKSTQRIFNCKLCPHTSLYGANLQNHIQVIHEKQRNYPCTLCDKRFSALANLRRHVEARHSAHREKVHSCDKCEYKAYSKDNLVHHVKRHNSSNRQECYFCQKQFVYFYELVPHFRRHTLEQ
ncbi:oocyte zinc finger protein XlCOF26-like [Folsomia candida]|uniref:C2H2-type domain-containing protein n=1 Tax=Folsomia candida TaxID=158441 RepID=A0A226DR12_FOLCA|nr:oocyte zinc finger protein XlCOF26-like [Folsomia candida]OXA47639.1 hypothetical protein Fcan01_17689 [Folsomia candida]